MNKSELITQLAEEHALPLDEATHIVAIFFDTIRNTLATGDRVEIRGFGSFKTKDYAGYKGRNPKTGTSVAVEPKRLPVFRSGKELRALINENAK